MVEIGEVCLLLPLAHVLLSLPDVQVRQAPTYDEFINEIKRQVKPTSPIEKRAIQQIDEWVSLPFISLTFLLLICKIGLVFTSTGRASPFLQT